MSHDRAFLLTQRKFVGLMALECVFLKASEPVSRLAPVWFKRAFAWRVTKKYHPENEPIPLPWRPMAIRETEPFPDRGSCKGEQPC
ncbi:hypothetical protein EV666_11146 [Camelimonas lactis]|uniref:Uncharacterized protein n=1 Tax=Camelimonas lactis TaxID=659006 RepID=A0A4R2GQH9_9HYPH|nr:hypothetical protein EV666_11146 [Camelimonas lactis]